MTIPQLLVHDKRDNVGVVVVENLRAADEMFCIVTEDNSDFILVASSISLVIRLRRPSHFHT